MPCEHDENSDLQKELARLTAPVQRIPAPRPGGTGIVLFVDPTETHEQEKLAALDRALSLVGARTRQRFEGLTVYLGPNCRCIAYAGEENGDRKQVLFLGNQMLDKTAVTMTEGKSGIKGGYGAAERGVADQQYDKARKSVLNPARVFSSKSDYQKSKIQAKAVAVIVHELGHLLHESGSTDKFWELKTEKNVEGKSNDRPPANLAMQVSQYATKSKLEFTAEVFTGLVYGTRYGRPVLDQYDKYGGYPVP